MLSSSGMDKFSRVCVVYLVCVCVFCLVGVCFVFCLLAVCVCCFCLVCVVV